MADETSYRAKLYLREKPEGRVGVPTLRGVLRIVRDGTSRELPLRLSDLPYSVPLQALPKPVVDPSNASPTAGKASLLLQDAGQEIELVRCKGALALMVIEETQPEGMPFLRKTTATLYWFDAGQCTEIVEYPSADLAYGAAEIRSGSRAYESRRQEREKRAVLVFWTIAGVIAAALLAFASLPTAVRVILWIALGIAVLMALGALVLPFLGGLWEGIALRAPRAAAATYLLLAILGLVGVIMFIPPVFNILLVILLGVAIAKQVHVLWVNPVPAWLVGGYIGAVVSLASTWALLLLYPWGAWAIWIGLSPPIWKVDDSAEWLLAAIGGICIASVSIRLLIRERDKYQAWVRYLLGLLAAVGVLFALTGNDMRDGWLLTMGDPSQCDAEDRADLTEDLHLYGDAVGDDDLMRLNAHSLNYYVRRGCISIVDLEKKKYDLEQRYLGK